MTDKRSQKKKMMARIVALVVAGVMAISVILMTILK